VASRLAVAGAVAILAGGAVIAYAVTRAPAGGMSGEQSAAMVRAIDKLDSEITAARSAVKERAATLSGLRVVQSTVVTDPQTVADQVARGELAFGPSNGEILELGQIIKASNTVVPLMIQPAGAMDAAHGGATGSYAELVGEQLVITEVVTVLPAYRADQFIGFLSVTRPLALAPVLRPLIDAGITGKLALGSRSVALGEMPADAAIHEQPLSSTPGARLIVAEPPPRAVMPVPVLVGGIAGAVLGLVLLLISLVRPRAATATSGTQTPAMPPQTGLPLVSFSASGMAHAMTQPSQDRVAAAGTPVLRESGSLRAVSSDFVAGAMIGRWEIVRRLGSGGMADVYLAQARGDGGFEKLVAIKVMHGHLARIQRAVDHFLDEARLAARIHHPNVVAIQDLGKIGNDYVIVMEYVEGVDLERLLISARGGQRPVPVNVALGILCRICDGLDAAHRATDPDGTPLGIIHRDVKSANVLVSRQGSVKVVDFGIAKAAKQVHFTVAGETKGTPAMMAPEQRVGEQIDVRADVYAVAAVGYELVTGHGVNLDFASLAHLGVENWPHLPPPTSLRRDLPPALDAILLGAMAFDRMRRPPDCAALGALCEQVMQNHQLIASDKDIARWIEGELRQLSPPFIGVTSGFSRSPMI